MVIQTKQLAIRDYQGLSVRDQPGVREIGLQCEAAAATHLDALSGGTALDPVADPLDGLRLPARAADGLRLVYFVMASRPFADQTVGRLFDALYSPAHLFLLHLDSKMDGDAAARLVRRLPQADNVRTLRKRRAVQWAGYSMVACLLDALHTAVERSVDFDFFINLSDTDLALRTDAEVVGFLRAHRGESFVSIVPPPLSALKYRQHAALRRFSFVECAGPAGAGFVVANISSDDIFSHKPRCCFGRSGHILYAPLPFARAESPAATRYFHGSQWAILSSSAAEYLVRSAAARQLAASLRNTFLPDEVFVQTALLADPSQAARLVNHNLRHLLWPHQFYTLPEDYWYGDGVPEYHRGGPMVLNSTTATSAMVSSALAARKLDPTVDASLLSVWDAWMARKRKGQHPAQQEHLGASLGELGGGDGLPRLRLPTPTDEWVPAGSPEQWARRLLPHRVLGGRRLKDGTPVVDAEFADGSRGVFPTLTHFGSGDASLKDMVHALSRVQGTSSSPRDEL